MTDEERKKEAERIVGEMTLKQKIELGSGKDFWHTKGFPRLRVEPMTLTDGPSGLRKQEGDQTEADLAHSVPATCFPAAVTTASTWNTALVGQVGEAIGRECVEEKVGILLGPGVNIKRSPLGGRDFEYFSEDPYLAGEMGAAFVSGVQETGVSACVKHFACNSQEYRRFSSDSQVDERTLREIYLPAFEKVVKKAAPMALMCAYNRINGTYCSENGKLLTDILRKEWGFNGIVMSDWGAVADRTKAYAAGLDLAMPGGSAYGEKEVLQAVKSGALSEETVTESAKRLMELILREKEVLRSHRTYSREEHDDLAMKAAEEGAVLLKNEEQFLPLTDLADTLLVGSFAEHMRYQGGGSSHMQPTYLTQVRDCMKECAFVSGCNDAGEVTPESLQEVTKKAALANRVIVFAGLPESAESEGFDRKDLSLPEGHLRMIQAAVDANPNTGVVLMGGGVMKLPFLSEVKAVLYAGLPGQAGGRAIARLLTGEANPSGHLAETWPFAEYDSPCYDTFGKTDAAYREGIYVGYRYYQKAGKRVCFPFGYGLSYTTFELSNLRLDKSTVSCMVQNVGKRPGSCVVQYYVAAPEGTPGGEDIHRPCRELKGFEKVTLVPGGVHTVTFAVNSRDFAVWQDGWKVPSGTYRLQLGFSCEEIILEADVDVTEEDVKEKEGVSGSWYTEPKGMPASEDWRRLLGKLPEKKETKPGTFDMSSTLADLRRYSEKAQELAASIEADLSRQGMDKDSADYRAAVSGTLDCSLYFLHQNTAGKVKLPLLKKILKEANRA